MAAAGGGAGLEAQAKSALKALVFFTLAVLAAFYIAWPILATPVCAITGSWGCEVTQKLYGSGNNRGGNEVPRFNREQQRFVPGNVTGGGSRGGEWGPKTKTSIPCSGKARGHPFQCGSASPTGFCICP